MFLKMKRNIETYRNGIGFKIPDFITLVVRGLACFTYAMISAWKFSIVFLAILPFVSILTSLLITVSKKYTIKELKSYEQAGKVAQDCLSSLRTVLAFGTMRKEIKRYEKNLHDAESLSIKKGLYTGILNGFALGVFNCGFAIGIYYGPYLIRQNCEEYFPDKLIRSLNLMITTMFAHYEPKTAF
jgi:ATP-binding cassette subfamily B (MDR/TAP) protein 1